jgi:xylan 1,4-beta-xylosidase
VDSEVTRTTVDRHCRVPADGTDRPDIVAKKMAKMQLCSQLISFDVLITMKCNRILSGNPATWGIGTLATLALATALMTVSAWPQNDSGATRHVVVNFTASDGHYKSLQGVDGGPLPLFDHEFPPDAPAFLRWQPANATLGYRAARIDLIRTHDSLGAGDIDAKFGRLDATPSARSADDIFPDMAADASNPASYNFGPTDRLIASIVDLGADVIFRLGRSAGAQPDPPDPTQYAAIARHIVMHYNAGWANGFHYGIKYWEVWNEPDLLKIFWSGTPAQFYALYDQVARAVKEADPTAQIGGPALSESWQAGRYREGFLDYVRSHALPLDFFSWHHYSTDANDPFDFVRIGNDIRQVLDRAHFTKTQSFVDEWNYGLVGRDLEATAMQRAAFVTSATLYMQSAPIDRSTLYRGDNIFGVKGDSPDKVGQALILLGTMQDTPLRLRSTAGEQDGFALQAGRSADGRIVQVLISNYQIPQFDRGPRPEGDVKHIPFLGDLRLFPRRNVPYANQSGYDAAIENLPAGDYLIRRYRISEAADFRLERAERQHTPVRIRSDLAAPGIEFVVVSRAD